MRQLLRDDRGVMVFLGVGTIAVPILEVDAVVLDRFAPKLVDEASVEPIECRMVRDAQGLAQRGGLWSVVVECA